MKFTGVFFDGKTSIPYPAELELGEQSFSILRVNHEVLTFPREAARFLDKIGTAPLVLEFDRQCRFLSEDPQFEKLKHDLGFGQDRIHWLESRWKIAILFLGLVIVLGVLFYKDMLPALAKKVAYRMPHEVEHKISEQTILLFDKSALFGPSKLSVAKQFEVQLLTLRLRALVPDETPSLIIKNGGKQIKANAFALPDGNIYVTDELINALTEEELIAVLCHEMGHVKNKHAVRSMVEGSLASVFLLSFSGNIDWSGVPIFLMTKGYSREFESEADAFAAKTLSAHQMDPKLLSSALKKIDPEYKKKPSRFMEFISTHPSTEDRIQQMDKGLKAKP